MKRRKLSRRDILQGAAAVAAGTVFASPVRAEAPAPVAITPALVDAARKEAKVILYSSMDLPVGEKLGKAFEAAYPAISVQIERSGSERLFQRLDQEFGSGIRAADVVNTSDASHIISWVGQEQPHSLAPTVRQHAAQGLARAVDLHHRRGGPANKQPGRALPPRTGHPPQTLTRHPLK